MDQEQQDVAASGSLTIVISTKQKPVSSRTFPEFSKHFKLKADVYGELPTFNLATGAFPDGDGKLCIDRTIEEVLKIYLICPSILCGRKAARSLFVFEILKQITCLFGGDFQLKPERPIIGNLGNGPVDYAIEFDNAIVMVTEAKKENMDQGVAQCAIQLDTAGKPSNRASQPTLRMN